MWRAWLLVLTVAAGCGGGSGGGASDSGSTVASAPAAGGVALTTLVKGLDQPVDVAGIPGSADLAIVEKTGAVRVWRDGRLLPRPLLDLTGHVSTGSEQGLLSIAFSPRYVDDHCAYIDYTDLNGNTHVAEVDTSSGSMRTILFVRQPYANHNGGALAFGPDGRLYVGMGDGGSEGDPQGNGQNPHSLLGKILRLDVSRPGSPPQMYALGLRNPWRFSFDPATGALWIGDVGQNRFEEIDRLDAGTPPGANLGWNLMEGNVPYKQHGISGPLVAPVAVYSHAHGCSVTGGVVYRGRDVPALRGRYVFGDFCSGTIWTMPAAGGRPRRLSVPTVQELSSFGTDTHGELYATSLSGSVLRFVTGP
jgi:glucose/arabinose dehydrogenase